MTATLIPCARCKRAKYPNQLFPAMGHKLCPECSKELFSKLQDPRWIRSTMTLGELQTLQQERAADYAQSDFKESWA